MEFHKENMEPKKKKKGRQKNELIQNAFKRFILRKMAHYRMSLTWKSDPPKISTSKDLLNTYFKLLHTSVIF